MVNTQAQDVPDQIFRIKARCSVRRRSLSNLAAVSTVPPTRLPRTLHQTRHLICLSSAQFLPVSSRSMIPVASSASFQTSSNRCGRRASPCALPGAWPGACVWLEAVRASIIAPAQHQADVRSCLIDLVEWRQYFAGVMVLPVLQQDRRSQAFGSSGVEMQAQFRA